MRVLKAEASTSEGSGMLMRGCVASEDVRLLISLCSSTKEAPEVLILCDPATRSIEPVSLLDPGMGVLGLCLTGGSLFCVVDRGRPEPNETEVSELYTLDPLTLRVRGRYTFRLGRDVHSLAAHGRGVFATSTGTDELVELSVDHEGRVVDENMHWQREGSAK